MLDVHHSHLFKYFAVTPAKFAILTNSVKYQFYTDLEETNKMDLKPFFEIDLLNLRNTQIEELKKIQKEVFDPEIISLNASQLKYTTSFKNLLEQEINSPSDDFVRHFIKSLYSGRVTQNILDSFRDIVKNGSLQYINKMLQNKLKAALNTNQERVEEIERDMAPAEEEIKINTTDEELQGFYIVKSIVVEYVDINRIFWRDNQNYFTIILDDKNYKWFCRLYFNCGQKYFVVPDENKKEQKFPINTLDDVYKFKNVIISALKSVL